MADEAQHKMRDLAQDKLTSCGNMFTGYFAPE